MTEFRNYQEVSQAVRNNYYQARIGQTVEYVRRQHKHYRERPKEKMGLWKVIEELAQFIDVSDPDVDIPNAHHLFQTAEAARKNKEEDWFVLTCFLHDIGKIMYRWGCDADGTSKKQQWGIVGDTFVVGTTIPDSIVFPEFTKDRQDYTLDYVDGCGLDATLVSWGHDEFMYQVLENPQNRNCFPEMGRRIIRYHSLYVWHQENEYSHLENELDRETKPWVKKFNQYDLYTKENLTTPIKNLKNYYNTLFLKFFPAMSLWF